MNQQKEKSPKEIRMANSQLTECEYVNVYLISKYRFVYIHQKNNFIRPTVSIDRINKVHLSVPENSQMSMLQPFSSTSTSRTHTKSRKINNHLNYTFMIWNVSLPLFTIYDYIYKQCLLSFFLFLFELHKLQIAIPIKISIFLHRKNIPALNCFKVSHDTVMSKTSHFF